MACRVLVFPPIVQQTIMDEQRVTARRARGTMMHQAGEPSTGDFLGFRPRHGVCIPLTTRVYALTVFQHETAARQFRVKVKG